MDIIVKDILERYGENIGKNKATLEPLAVNVGKNIEDIGKLKKFYRRHKKGILIAATLGVAAIVISAYSLLKSSNAAQKIQDHMDIVEGKDVTNAMGDLDDIISDLENTSARYASFAHFSMDAKEYSAALTESLAHENITNTLSQYENITNALDNLTRTSWTLERGIESNLSMLQKYVDRDVKNLTEYDIAAIENTQAT